MLRHFRSQLLSCRTARDVVAVLDDNIKRMTSQWPAGERLRLRMDMEKYNSRAVECVDGTRREVDVLLADRYVRLSTTGKCNLSLLGIERDDDDLIVTTTTLPSQQRKGYNALMRAVAVMIAWCTHTQLVSDIANRISAYTLLKTYQCTVVWKSDDSRHLFLKPLTKEDAWDTSKRVAVVIVRPTNANMRVASRNFLGTAIKRPAVN